MTKKEVYEGRRGEWIGALRSGKFEQTSLGLHRPGDGYCCLGVGAEVSKLGFWSEDLGEKDTNDDPLCSWILLEYEGDVNIIDPDDDDATSEIPREACLLPGPAMEYYGVNGSTGGFRWFSLPTLLRWAILKIILRSETTVGECEIEALMNPDSTRRTTISLVFLNDHGVPFDLIADVLEAEPDGLFRGGA